MGGIVLIVLLALLIFLFARWLYLRRAGQEARWSVLFQYALRHRLRGPDLQVLRSFFDSLNEGESLQVLHNRRLLHARLHDYLYDARSIATRDRVRILDSMFPLVDFQLEIKSLRDLQAGELCSLEFDRQTFLGTIVREKEVEVWVSIPGWQVPDKLAGTPAQVYVFRPNIGGFLLEGRILRSGKELLVFGDVSKITSQGNQHLMAEIEVPFRLTSWPPPTAPEARPGDQTGEAGQAMAGSVTPEKDVAGRTGAAPPVPEPAQYLGTTKLISDRALLFFLNEGHESTQRLLLESQEVWEIDLSLPRGTSVRCRGVVLPSAQGARSRWIFKYIDADETLRRAIFEEIKRAGAKRERLV